MNILPKSGGEQTLRGKGGGGGVPWVQIMENEFEYLADRGGQWVMVVIKVKSL